MTRALLLLLCLSMGGCADQTTGVKAFHDDSVEIVIPWENVFGGRDDQHIRLKRQDAMALMVVLKKEFGELK